jgi:NCS1 family nucleobase:cation symporter-1
MAAVLLAWAVHRAGGVGPMLTQPSRFATLGEFWKVFVPSLTGMVGFWATLSLNIPDFTRYGRGQREQMLGQALGLPTTMIAFSAMALVITSASAAVLHGTPIEQLWNPEFLLGQMTSPKPPMGLTEPLIVSDGVRAAVAFIAVIGIVIATVSVNIAANVVSPANDFANLAPKYISFKTGGLITGIFGILCMPWKLMADPATYLDGWLGGVGGLLGPVAGVMIADYWIVRGKKLDVPELFRPNGIYKGINPVAIFALALGILPNLPGFLQKTKFIGEISPIFGTIYPYAWFSGVAISGVAYVIGMRMKGEPKPAAA